MDEALPRCVFLLGRCSQRFFPSFSMSGCVSRETGTGLVGVGCENRVCVDVRLKVLWLKCTRNLLVLWIPQCTAVFSDLLF